MWSWGLNSGQARWEKLLLAEPSHQPRSVGGCTQLYKDPDSKEDSGQRDGQGVRSRRKDVHVALRPSSFAGQEVKLINPVVWQIASQNKQTNKKKKRHWAG